MKKGITYLFLIVYATVMFKPIVPYITDLTAHIFWNYEHISTVHFEHGKYHAHIESLEAARKQDPEKNGGAAKFETAVPEHIIEEEGYTFHTISTIVETFLPVYFFTKQLYHSDNFRPPKA